MAAINFKNVDVKKPIKEPKAALNALFESLLSFIISPKYAPKKGPIIIPKGGKNNKPSIKPTIVPMTP